MYGIVITPIAILIGSISMLGIGTALIIDELTLFFTSEWNHEGYFSYISWIGTVIFSIIIFLLRKNITSIMT